MNTAKGRRLHVGRRNAVQKNVKLTTIPECDSEEEEERNGPKKALFIDYKPLNIRRTLKPLHEINNFQFSSSKSKSYEKLHIPKSTYMDMFHKHNKIPLSPPYSPPSIMKILASTPKKRRKPSKPVLQPKELFKTLIDSSFTKFEKAQFSYASSSASNYLSFRI